MKHYGIEDPYTYFNDLNDKGVAAFIEKESKNKDKDATGVRPPKTWKLDEAWELVGMSRSWLAANSDDAPRDENNYKVWDLELIEKKRAELGTEYRRPEGSDPFNIAFIKQKGGVGNSTATIHAAHYFAMHGQRVLVVDLDPQATTTAVLGGYNPDTALDQGELFLDALLKAPEDFKFSLQETYFKNVYLAPANGILKDFEIDIIYQSNDVNDFPVDENDAAIAIFDRLNKGLEGIRDQFDIILFDCPPNIATLASNALEAADSLVSVVRPAPADVSSTVSLTSSLAAFYYNANRPLRYWRLLISQEKEDSVSKDYRKFCGNWVGPHLMTNAIKSNAEVPKALGSYHSVFSAYKAEASRHSWKAGKDTMKAVFKEMLDDLKAIWAKEAEEA